MAKLSLRALLVAGAATTLVVLASCKSNTIETDNSTNITVGQLCAGGGASAASCTGSVCALNYCRQPCSVATDCPAGSICLAGPDGARGCRLPGEASCDPARPCTQGLVCADDRSCRNACDDATGCAVAGNTCRGGACSSPTEPGPGPGPTGDGGGGPSCEPACGAGFQCVDGTCAACGAENGPCCGTLCGSGTSCVNGTCKCGEPGAKCCGGTTCNGGGTCVGGVCACGGAYERCCATTPACSKASLACGGVSCSCITSVMGAGGSFSALAVRSDGTAWLYSNYGSVPVVATTNNGSPFVGKAFARGASYVCAVRADDTVWCWSESNNPNTNNGQLGNGAKASSLLPVQVVTDGIGTPLTGMKKIFAGGATSCAVDGAGALWCWGAGGSSQLANGGVADLAVATKALASAGGAQFTGVDEVALSNTHGCARKTDNTVWCWGSNANGAIGINSGAATVPYPSQVTDLFATATQISVGGSSSCARTNDGSVWCWGTNQYGQLGNGLSTGFASVPARVLASLGGAPFAGASKVVVLNQNTCLLKTADTSIWCWGTYRGAGLTPVQLIENSVPVVGASYLGGCNVAPAYLGSDGKVHLEAGIGTTGKATNQVPCP